MGVRADRRESTTEEFLILDEGSEFEPTAVRRTTPTRPPISQVRAHWRADGDVSDNGTWDETSHTTWDDALDAPSTRTSRTEECDESEAARLVNLATRLTVADVMDGVSCVRPDARLDEIADVLREHEVVVADRHGVPLGVVQRGLYATGGARTCAGQVMEPVGTLEETDRLSKALGLMAAQGIRFMCVVSSEQCVVGLIYGSRALAQLSREAQRTRRSAAQL